VPAATEAGGTTVNQKPAPTRNGYTFTGWFTQEKGGTEYSWPYTFTASLTMHAQWTAIVYDITYNNLNGADNTANLETYTIESADITLEDPDHGSYRFGGWYKDGGFKNPATETPQIPKGSMGEKTFYARWKPQAPFGTTILQPVPSDPVLAEKTVSVGVVRPHSTPKSPVTPAINGTGTPNPPAGIRLFIPCRAMKRRGSTNCPWS
jgi:uncharacterized repeat protein (TIGR02543 family)